MTSSINPTILTFHLFHIFLAPPTNDTVHSIDLCNRRSTGYGFVLYGDAIAHRFVFDDANGMDPSLSSLPLWVITRVGPALVSCLCLHFFHSFHKALVLFVISHSMVQSGEGVVQTAPRPLPTPTLVLLRPAPL
jgi:hypothetical protein